MFSFQLCSNHPIWDLISSTSLKLLPPPVFPFPASQKIKVNMAKRKQFIFSLLQLIISLQCSILIVCILIVLLYSYTVYFSHHGPSLIQKQIYKQPILAKFEPLFNVFILHIRKCDTCRWSSFCRLALPAPPPSRLGHVFFSL